jgi:hypothetical protein
MRIVVEADGSDLITAQHAEFRQAFGDRILLGRVIVAY